MTSTKVGRDFGYELVWVVVLAGVLMVTMTTLAARLGVMLEGTPCDEIARRAGRPFAAFVGVVLFLVVACFQFSNNVAVVAAVTPYVGPGSVWPIVLLVCLNLLVLGVLFGLRRLYQPIERLMKLLVGLMLLGFLGNLALARPSVQALLAGLLPALPERLAGGGGKAHDPLLPVQGLIATTFSVAAAFYQAYLVRQKGWTRSELGRGFFDSVVGISVLTILTLTIMVTAAEAFHGRVQGVELESVADIAVQLEPLFGRWATLLFSLGLLAGALSSFLINVMIGGTVMSDGLGLGGDMDQRWPKVFTAAALLTGMSVAIASLDERPVRLIIFAQAMTVLGNPVLAGVLLWLSMWVKTPRWIQVVGLVGFVVVLLLAVRTGIRIYLTMS